MMRFARGKVSARVHENASRTIAQSDGIASREPGPEVLALGVSEARSKNQFYLFAPMVTKSG